MIANGLIRFLADLDVAIDLGTANTRICVLDRCVVADQPTRELPADLAVEVLESGICLSGGGACLRGMNDLSARETFAEVRVAAGPLRSTINGAGEILAGLRQTGTWEADW
jgi:actin-like ATPase involved in cell morphogenesis